MRLNYLALVLGTALATSMLVGCGENEQMVVVEDTQEEAAIAEEETEEADTAKENEIEADISGTYIHTFEEEYEGEIVVLSESVVLNEDMSCNVTIQDTISGTYDANTISLDDGSEYSYTINGDELVLDMDGVKVTFIRSEQTAMDEVAAEDIEMAFTFSTTDIDGKEVKLEDYSGAKLIMVNFWEPWCGPCVGEMPELEKLYEEYKGDGFVILGVFGTADMTEEAKEVMDSCGITYPILNYVDSLEQFTTDYVPTTVFLDQYGNELTTESIIGSNSYDGWKQIIEEYMNR